MNFSTVPPWRSIAPRISWKYENISSRTVSASTRSPIAVEPDMSQKSSVASLRRSGAVGSSGSPAHAAEPEALRVLLPARRAEHPRISRSV